MRNPQLNRHGELTHLITTEGLSRAILLRLLDTAETYITQPGEELENVPALQGKRILNLVTDSATLEVAQRLMLEADMLLVRTPVSGLPYLLAQQVGPRVHVINEGDGYHADPLGALMDMFTIRHVKKDFSNLTVAIVGDILHSRLARSDIHALTTLGVAEVRVAGPLTLLPEGLAQLGVRACAEMSEGLRDADVIIMLEFEHQRIDSGDLPSKQDYLKRYGLTAEKLACAKPDCLVISAEMNRDALAVAVRKTVMSIVAGASL